MLEFAANELNQAPDLPTVVFIGPFLLWFSALMAVLAGVGCTPPRIKGKVPPKIVFAWI